MPTLKNRQRVGLGDFSGVRRQQPMRQNGCSLTRLFLAGILSQLYALYTATPIEQESGDKSPVYRVIKVPVTLLNMNKDTALIEGEFDGLPSVVRAGVAHLSADQRVHVANGDTHFFNE